MQPLLKCGREGVSTMHQIYCETRPRSSTGTVIVALANMYQTVGHSMKIQPDMTPFSYSILLLASELNPI